MDLWKKFTLTGRVSDYLQYRLKENSSCEFSEEFSYLKKRLKQQGAESRARVFNCDGNDNKADAGGRV